MPAQAKPKVGVVMGSDSDLPKMAACCRVLEEYGIPFEVRVLSAHRTPKKAADYAATAASRGLRVLVAGAGGAAHLAGALAAWTTLPVIAVPVDSTPLAGFDALLASVQMPRCRVISGELGRICSHLLGVGAAGMDMGALTPFTHALRERELINDLIEELCGARLTYNYMRIGGVAWDLPPGYQEKVLEYLDHLEPVIHEMNDLLSYNKIYVGRLANVAVKPGIFDHHGDDGRTRPVGHRSER